MKKPEAVMEILEAFDLTGSVRAAAGLVGCDHKPVAYWVRQRDEAGGMPVVQRSRPAMEQVFATKIDELVDRSHGQIRADVAHGKLVAIGYLGSERTTRRWVAESKRRWRRRHGRRTRPWIPEPGLWMQWDYGDGPTVEDRSTVLFCAWLAWSRFRVAVPLRDETLPSVVVGLDRALRMFGGCPTYALTEYVPGHIFVSDLREHPAEPLERLRMQLQERRLSFDQRRLTERRTRERRPDHEQMHLHRHATEHHQRLPPVDLSFDARRVDWRNTALPPTVESVGLMSTSASPQVSSEIEESCPGIVKPLAAG